MLKLGDKRPDLGVAQIQRVAVRARCNDTYGGTVEPGVETVFGEQLARGFSGFEDFNMRSVAQRFINDYPKRH